MGCLAPGLRAFSSSLINRNPTAAPFNIHGKQQQRARATGGAGATAVWRTQPHDSLGAGRRACAGTPLVAQLCRRQSGSGPMPSAASETQAGQGRRSHVVAAAVAAAAAPALAPGTAAAAATAATVSSGPTAASVFAVLLGYACMIGSCFRSVPQIVKIVQAGTTEGLSLVSNLTELLCYTVIVAYNLNQGYAFNTFGEVFACWLQDIVLVALILRDIRTPTPIMVAATAAFAVLCAWIFTPGNCPMHVLSALQLSTLVVMALGSRVPQIMLNIKRGNAGVLSLTTCILNVTGNVIRTFTTLVLTQDTIILCGCVTQFMLNTVLLLQCWDTVSKERKAKAAASATQIREGPEDQPPVPAMPSPAPQLA